MDEVYDKDQGNDDEEDMDNKNTNYNNAQLLKEMKGLEDDIKEHNQLRELKNKRNNIYFALLKRLV